MKSVLVILHWVIKLLTPNSGRVKLISVNKNIDKENFGKFYFTKAYRKLKARFRGCTLNN